MSTSTYRLPTHALPRRYDVKLDAQVGRPEFQGSVAIDLELQQASASIELHGRDLAVRSATLTRADQAYPAAVTVDAENERLLLQFSRPLLVGAARLTLEFDGKVSDALRGLYLAQNRPEQVLCTQCEATDARAVFPCFDEPTFKARFAFEVTTSAEAAVLANGPLESVTDHGATRTWKFAATPVMSSYLIALVIGDVAGTPERQVNGIPLRVWAMRGKEGFGSFALDYTARLLPWYEDYFAQPYPYQKYDQAAVPGFAAGAMENSGLVLFRQELLIMAPESRSWRQEKNIAQVVAHEFAHMWFGNLVTMQWWDDLWLNEAFAEWISHRAVAELSPDLLAWEEFGNAQNYALEVDGLETTHPIYSPVETPAQAQELFDAITYVKGCSVLRMLETFLEPFVFRAGLRTYMQEFAERNARGADLWRHLQSASAQPVTEIIESWILQPGHPVVRVECFEADGNVQLQLTQQRFCLRPQGQASAVQTWKIPLIIRYADEAGLHQVQHLMTAERDTVPLTVQGRLHWCTANADQIGFYRQHLPADLLTNLLAHVEALTAGEQTSLLGDQWALLRSGQQNVSQFLAVLEALARHSAHHAVLLAVLERLQELERMLEAHPEPETLIRFRAWVRSLFRARFQALGFSPHPDESENVMQERLVAIRAMTLLGAEPEAVAEARRLAQSEAEDPRTVDPNLADLLVTIDARFGDYAAFQKHVDVYQARKARGAAPELVTRYVYSFPAFRPPELVAQSLSLLDEGIAPREAALPILHRMLQSFHAQRSAWEYMKSNWAWLKDLGLGSGHLFKSAGELPYALRADVQAFYESNARGLADMTYAQGLENMDLREEFRQRTEPELSRWFDQRVPEAAERAKQG